MELIAELGLEILDGAPIIMALKRKKKEVVEAQNSLMIVKACYLTESMIGALMVCLSQYLTDEFMKKQGFQLGLRLDPIGFMAFSRKKMKIIPLEYLHCH